MRQAILGYDNCRVDDLKHMLGFTHTGLIGQLLIVRNISFILMPYILLESFNSLHNKYASKSYYYGYQRFLNCIILIVVFRPSGMMARAALAALDWNSNLLREQVIKNQKPSHIFKNVLQQRISFSFIPSFHHFY